jgi:endonuclease YncB( thermonuclease family)
MRKVLALPLAALLAAGADIRPSPPQEAPLHAAAGLAAAAPPSAPAKILLAEAQSDLPTIAVPQRPAHTVPDSDSAPPRPVTLKERDGRDITSRSPPQMAARHLPSAPPQLPALTISGPARVDQAAALMVRGRSVLLFGVRAPQAGDRCAASAGMAPRACHEVARELLAARLRGNDTVFCRVPRGQRNGATAAVCLDARGVDLGGLLVGEGFALADPKQSYDYAGAEGVARSARRGLWRYR